MKWVDEIIDAMKALGGAARYSDLYRYVELTTDRSLTKHWKATVRRTIETQSSDSDNFKRGDGQDLFEKLDRGFWGLRGSAGSREAAERWAELSPEEVVDRVLVSEHRRKLPTRRSDATAGAVFHMVPGGPRPVAPFSHAVECDGWVILTGQMPTDPEAPEAPLPKGVAAQTVRVKRNLEIVLNGVGLDLSHVVQCRCFLTAFERDYAAFNATYERFFPESRRPARTTVGVTALAVGALVEIDCLARRPSAVGAPPPC